MKKKFLFSLIIIIGLFVITSCAADNEKLSQKFYELKYLEPEGYSSESDFEAERDITKYYFYGEYEASINLTYNQGKDYSEVENLFYNEHIETDINDTTWRVMDDNSGGVESRFYYTVYNNDLYLIELNGIDKYEKEMSEFIKHVSFK